MDEKELPYYQLEGQQKQIEIFVNGKSSMVPFFVLTTWGHDPLRRGAFVLTMGTKP